MDKWFQYAYYLGLLSIGLVIGLNLWLYANGSAISLSSVIINCLPGIILMLLAIYKTQIWGVEQFPSPIPCPHCTQMTDKNPCSHCGKDVFVPKNKFSPEDKQKDKQRIKFYWVKWFIGFFRRSKAFLAEKIRKMKKWLSHYFD